MEINPISNVVMEMEARCRHRGKLAGSPEVSDGDLKRWSSELREAITFLRVWENTPDLKWHEWLERNKQKD